MPSNKAAITVFLPATGEHIKSWVTMRPDKRVQRLFRRAGQQTIKPFKLYRYLHSYLHSETGDDPAQSIAGYRYLSDTGRVAADWVLCADPVYLQPDRDQLLLGQANFSDLDMADAQVMVDTINETITLDHWQLEVASATHWYLHFSLPLQVSTASSKPQQGAPIGHDLVGGVQRKNLLQQVNTVQMLLHSNPVNQRRQAEGKTPVNSVLPWGSEVLQAEPGVNPDTRSANVAIWSDESVVRGMAKAAGLQVNATGQWSVEEARYDRCLLVMPDDPVAAEVNFTRFVSPLIDALNDNSIDSLQLISDDGCSWHATGKQLRRWW